jgi:hypothetical protein
VTCRSRSGIVPPLSALITAIRDQDTIALQKLNRRLRFWLQPG